MDRAQQAIERARAATSPEAEIMIARRAWPVAQRLLSGAAVRQLPERVEVGWHGTTVDPAQGAYAVVRGGAGLDDLLGAILRLTVGDRSAFVYVLGARAVPTDISIARRAFLALGLLALESLTCIVEVIG